MPSQKKIAGIPIEAEYFSWSYSVEGVKYNPHLDDMAFKVFAAVGGFIYLDGTCKKVLKACAIRPASTGELCFGERATWMQSWTQPFIEKGRFQKVKLKELREVGALYFCWLNESEKVGEPSQSRVICPNVGGFAYLFSPTGEDVDIPLSSDMPGVYFEAKGGGADKDIIRSMPCAAWRTEAFKQDFQPPERPNSCFAGCAKICSR